MSEGILAFLRRDLGSALIAGVARTPQVPPDGVRWLQAWALACAVAGLSLYLACGYHAGFLRINAWAAGTPPWIWQWLTALGDERVPFALALLFSRRYPQVFWALVVAGLIGIAYTHLGKHVIDALRPPAVLDPGQLQPHRAQGAAHQLPLRAQRHRGGLLRGPGVLCAADLGTRPA